MQWRSFRYGIPVLGAMLVPARPAHADDGARVTSSESYALPLGLSYLALPALAAAAAAAFPDANEDQGAALVAGVVVLGLGAPVAVHLVYDQPERALVSPLGAAGSTLVLGIAGLGVGTLIADSRCGSGNDESTSSCRLTSVVPLAYAAAILGYLGWALYDTAADSSVEARDEPKLVVTPDVSHRSAGIRVFASF